MCAADSSVDCCPSVKPNPTANSSGKLFCLIPLALSLFDSYLCLEYCKKDCYFAELLCKDFTVEIWGWRYDFFVKFLFGTLFMFNVFGFVGMFSSVKVNPFK